LLVVINVVINTIIICLYDYPILSFAIHLLHPHFHKQDNTSEFLYSLPLMQH